VEEGAVVAEGLTKRYGDFTAVDGINLTVKRGEIYGLLGPNGAGKTTTVRMLTTLTQITSGNAWVNGYSVREEPLLVKRSIGLVPDVSNLYDELTVEENLLFAARLYNAPIERVRELIREFDLPANKKFGKLSSGFKRRTTIAAALVHRPEVLFMDEPTTALDVSSARNVRNLIRLLNKEGITVFITTHNMIDAESLPHRIGIIKEGKIIAEGKGRELKELMGKGMVVKLLVEPITSKLINEIEAYSPTFDEGFIVVTVEDVDEFLEELFDLKMRLGFKVKRISTELPTIEDVFVELTERNGCSCGGCPL